MEKHFCVITNELKDKGQSRTGHICGYLESRGARCTRLAGRRSSDGEIHVDPSLIPADTCCVLVLGGDGTMLQAARDLVSQKVPLLGVNLGTLGYLAEVEYCNVDAALDLLLAGEYAVQERMMLSGEALREGQVSKDAYALNDIVITRNGPLQMMHFHIYVNGQLLKSYGADGIIVATPTGSTGYNISAGGPIVEPTAQLILLTPICPHTLNTRSIVLGAQDEVAVEVGSRADGERQQMEVSFDGSRKMTLSTGEALRINRSGYTTRFVKLRQDSFLEVLHRKMSE